MFWSNEIILMNAFTLLVATILFPFIIFFIIITIITITIIVIIIIIIIIIIIYHLTSIPSLQGLYARIWSGL